MADGTQTTPVLPPRPKVDAALAAAREHPEVLGHLEHVARLAVLLFDELAPLHGLGDRERELLCCAALLHDVGVSVRYKGHHKHSLRLILDNPLPGFSPDEMLLVANLARYHRKARPKAKHEHFQRLDEADQETVRRLAAILRLADGLDRAHEDAVEQVDAVRQSPVQWVIEVRGRGDLGYAVWAGERKAPLFEETFGAAVRFEPKGKPC
ncbi:MAG: HD domain-containing protein [Planctomycetota bacterium]